MSNENEVEVEEKKDVNEEERPPEANEPIKSYSDLEQEKQRRAQELYAQGNIGYTQIFIQSMGNLNMDTLRKFTSASAQSSSKQTYKLHTRQGCAEFVEQYKNSEHLAVAIVLSTFELVRLSDLNELKTLLIEELPEVESSEEDDTLTVRDPYISVNTFLSLIEGELFSTQDGQQCVGLGEHSQQALKTLWEQFPALRDPICRWLVRLCRVYKFRTAFDAHQIVCAFVRVISLDFEDAQKRVFSRLRSDSDNAALLGNIMCMLYGYANLSKKVERMLLDWLESRSSWLWSSACLACAFLMSETRNDSVRNDVFDLPLKKALNRRLIFLTGDDSAFMSVLLNQSEYFRTMLADLLGDAVCQSQKHSTHMVLAQTYLFLLRGCYYLVNADYPELPLAACDSKRQQQSLIPVLREVISQISTRSQLYAIMRAYLEELSRYQYSQQLIKHLCAFFYSIAQSSPDYWSDILQFLYNCKGTPSKQIFERLRTMYHPTKQLSSTTY